MMTYREDLIFVTHMKFDFVSGEEKRDNHGIYTSIIVQVNMYIREHARLCIRIYVCIYIYISMCVIILLVCKVKGNKDNGDLTQEGQIDHPSLFSLISVFKCRDLFRFVCLTIKHSLNHHITSRLQSFFFCSSSSFLYSFAAYSLSTMVVDFQCICIYLAGDHRV